MMAETLFPFLSQSMPLLAILSSAVCLLWMGQRDRSLTTQIAILNTELIAQKFWAEGELYLLSTHLTHLQEQVNAMRKP